jgi:putative FmdB family regulatory protein
LAVAYLNTIGRIANIVYGDERREDFRGLIMPIYMYKCSECSHRFEFRQRFSDDPLSKCPVCKGKIRRVINSVGLVFKGSGFYITDNRNGKSNGSLSSNAKNAEKQSSSREKPKEKSTEVTVDKGKSESSATSAAA